jgi:molybdopterin synthase catalytic subunit
MKFEIRLFATLKDRAGSDWITVVVEPDHSATVNVKALLAAVAAAYPALGPALKTSLVAVNKAFAFAETAIQPGDEIALFPPVSGGAEERLSLSSFSTLHSPHPTCFMVIDGPLDVAEIHARLARPDVGAIATFTGYVRGETSREGLPPETLFLEYEAYREMAESKMAQIAGEIWERWPLVKGIAIIQRTGRLKIGEVTTFVACAAGHRDQGIFEAARYGIDRLKEIVPVWKKEVGSDQSVWIEGHYRPTESD